MASVEIRTPPAEVAARLEELRRWLQQRGCAYSLASTGSRDEAVLIFDFPSHIDANDFAEQFGGTLVPS